MFGLMRAKVCSQSTDLRDSRRVAYCGTCKTLGARYGQRTRMLLNHDTVFMAEVLCALDGDAPPLPLEKAYRAFSCLSMPRDFEAAPFPLRHAAAATLFIAEAMLEDHRQDEPSRLLDVASHLLSGPFQQAEADLTAWGLPTAPLRELLASQIGLERRAAAFGGSLPEEELLTSVAEPTTRGLGILFEFGAVRMAHPKRPLP